MRRTDLLVLILVVFASLSLTPVPSRALDFQDQAALCPKVGPSIQVPRRVGVVNALHDYWYEPNSTAAADIAGLGMHAIKLWPTEHYLSAGMRAIYEDPRFDVIVIRPLENSVIESGCQGLKHYRWENIDYGAVARDLYANVGHLAKTIILTGWEGDWQIKGLGCNRVPTQQEQDAYLALLNARQNGVAAARQDNANKALVIYNAVEVNHVLNTQFRLIDTLIPQMDMKPDMVSYSHWSTSHGVRETLDYISTQLLMCPSRLMLGEIGRSESVSNDPYSYIYTGMSEAFDMGASLAFLWSYRDQFSCPKSSGLWLRRCDSSLASTYQALVDLQQTYE